MTEFTDISVRILSDISSLKAGMAQAQASLARVEAAAGSLRSVWSGLQSALAGYGVYRLASAMYAAGQAIDETAKAARRLGVSTAEMQAFRLAAEYSGVGVETAERAMTRLAAAAARGTGPAVEALQRLGLSASSIDAEDVSGSMYRVLAALQAVEDPAERARISLDLFGRSGYQMVELTSGVDQARASIAALGSAMSDDAARRVEAANDAVTTLHHSLQAFLAGLYADAAPVLQAHAETWATIVSWLNRARAGYDETAASAERATRAEYVPDLSPSETEGRGLSDLLRRAEEQARAEADRMREATRTPIERAQADYERALDLREAGMLDDDTVARLADRVTAEYQRMAEEAQRAIDEQREAEERAAADAARAWEQAVQRREETLGVPGIESELRGLLEGRAGAEITARPAEVLGATTDAGAARFLGAQAIMTATQRQVMLQERIVMLMEQLAYRRQIAYAG